MKQGRWEEVGFRLKVRNGSRGLAIRCVGILVAVLLTIAQVACQERPEFITGTAPDVAGDVVVASLPLYDYAPWPDEPTPTPWPEGVIPFIRHIAQPDGARELLVDTEPLYQHFQYTLRDVQIAAGERVTFNFKARKEYHTFTIDGLGIDEVITPGQSNKFSYTFHIPGSYEFYCIPHPYMTGVITIGEAE